MARIAIVGAGAIGGWVGATLARAGHDVSVLARGATLEALLNGGIVLEKDGQVISAPVRASADAASLGEQDIVVIAVKAQSLPALAPTLAPLVSDKTIILPLLNGVPWWFAGEDEPLISVDPDGVLARSLPFAQVIGCVVHASASVVSPGRAMLRMGDRLILGEPAGGRSERVEAVAALILGAGLPAVISENVRLEIWYKLWGNMTVNPISALTLATADRILDDPLVSRFILAIMAEARAIGAAIGCPIEQSGEDRNTVTRKLGAFKTSMLQDVEAGRSIELDALLAAPREIAARLGQPVPAIDALLGLTRLMGSSRGIYPGT
ncbi:MAG: 2-dehydropantoate 2-reductase [Novosphingobium sp.]